MSDFKDFIPIKEKLADKIEGLPLKPGVYIMRDKTGAIIYIGKAVVLKNRVRQYFNNSPKLVKVQAMVDNIADFDYMITLTEKDALTLEANLIRKHKPKYNILLKDDKSSPYIKIDMREKFPTIEVVRGFKRDGAKYFGPYFNGIYVWDIVGIIKGAYRMRACSKHLAKNTRECLNFYIDLCVAPCSGRVSVEEYNQIVTKVIDFLSGREDSAERLITQKMELMAQKEEFERAISYRNQLEMLKKLKLRTVANLGSIFDLDVFNYASDGEASVVSIVLVRGGKMMGVKNFNFTDASFNIQEALVGFITQYYGSSNEIPEEICLPAEFETSAIQEFLYSVNGKKTAITFPKIGAKKDLIKMALDNASDYLVKSIDKERREYSMTIGACDKLAKLLNLPSVRRMECYDISNISGVDKVASQVVFINGAPSKSDYRKYKIKTVEGANDFASMAEVIKRRFKNYAEGDAKFSELPDLIVIDGGKGQLGYALQSMRAEGQNVPMVSLAEREEEIYIEGSPLPIIISKETNELKLLIRIRDEAHRFAITYHRNVRQNRYLSTLESIHGVGKTRCKILLKTFPNFNDIKTADVKTLSAIKGIDQKTAIAIADYFSTNKG